MKKITRLFPGVDESTVSRTLKKFNVVMEDPDKTFFSDVNLVTGPNGAGKTRLLNALLELYRQVQDVEILYGYFPTLACNALSGTAKSGLRKYTLWEFRGYNRGSFHDLFQEIEWQHRKFIPQLLRYESETDRDQKRAILGQISQFFQQLTGKKLLEVARSDRLYMKESGGTAVPLSEALEKFSPGEWMLFYMSIFFSLKRDGDRNWVIILDEPESHLHPKALLKFIKTLRSTFPGAVIWIATHSLFLLPEFEFENIVYMEDSKVLRRRSDLYRKALSGLLGEDNENVSRFFASLPHWQYYEFIAECFTNPTVVSTVNPADEQVRIFIEALKEYKITRVLDCGGGSGRLGLSMMETTVAEWQNVTYDIYDAWPTYKGRKFKVYKQLENAPGKYDCVVMMNFLHEVPPQEWSSWFHKIYDLMVPGGYLLFVEVEALRTGECPNDTGYLVLGTAELDSLFDAAAGLPEIRLGDKQKSIGVLVAREYLRNVEDKTVSAAVQGLERRAYQELYKIRGSKNLRRASGKGKLTLSSADEHQRKIDARRYAFFSQQYINAKLFNDRAEKPPESDELSQISFPAASVAPQEKAKTLLAFLKDANDLLDDAAFTKDTQREAIRMTFRDAVNSYLTKGHVSERRLILCRDMIEAVEAISSNRRLIYDLWQIGSILGDPICAGRLRKQYFA